MLFYTCSVNFNEPQVGKDAVEVFAKNGISLTCPKQNCCGMPAIEQGDIELAKRLAAQNVASLYPHVRDGKKVVAIDPTCSYMLRKEYPELVGTVEAREVAAATRDLCEFLFELKQQGRFCRDFRSTPGSIAYHLPCHLKAQNIGYRSRDLMRLIPGTKITLVEHCSGHDGTWAMKKEFFPLSMLTGKKAFEAMAEAGADVLASDCPLASIQFDQALGTRPIHPIQVLARAYRADGFPKPDRAAASHEARSTSRKSRTSPTTRSSGKSLRPRIIALKDRRRIRVGGHLTFLFENRDTVRYQIQEMMRIERIVEADAIRHEVDTYNELIPFRGELSATLLIEYDSPEERNVALHDLRRPGGTRLDRGRGARSCTGALRYPSDLERPAERRTVCQVPADARAARRVAPRRPPVDRSPDIPSGSHSQQPAIRRIRR